jgi:hypothetical protein
MKPRNILLTAVLAITLAAAGWWSRSFAPDPQTPVAQPATSASPASPAVAANEEVAASPAVAPAASIADDGDPDVIAFRVDVNGRVVTNEKARLDLEKLYALYSPPDRARKLQELENTLPPAGAQHLTELMTQYGNYQEAQYQTFPPGREMVSAVEGLREIDGMHALRVQYFGEQVTNDMFGEEEQVQRELYRLMAVETDQSLTLEERAERAQQMYSTSMPAVAAAERKAAAEEARRR